MLCVGDRLGLGEGVPTTRTIQHRTIATRRTLRRRRMILTNERSRYDTQVGVEAPLPAKGQVHVNSFFQERLHVISHGIDFRPVGQCERALLMHASQETRRLLDRTNLKTFRGRSILSQQILRLW